MDETTEKEKERAKDQWTKMFHPFCQALSAKHKVENGFGSHFDSFHLFLL